MYRLVVYYLIALLAVAGVFGYFGKMPYQPLEILFSTVFILVVCVVTNKFFAYMFDAPSNVESVYITGLILALIISPIQGLGDTVFFALATWASIIGISSKYLLAIKKKHIFNPVVVGVVVTAFTIGLSASWWVGTVFMVPFVIAGGVLLVKKIHRFDLVLSFFFASLVLFLGHNLIQGKDFLDSLQNITLNTPLFFFAFVMLTEPLTTAPTRALRIGYGAITGVLFAPFVHLGLVFSTPELALLIGNIYSYIVSPKYKMILAFKRREEVARDTFDFVFEKDRDVTWRPGQYLEWTLTHGDSDSRGVRRFFTIASSPTESEMRMGVKFYPNPSSFKTVLHGMQSGEEIVASQLSGDFTMPKNKNKKLVFVAGGIGVTPFRSMIKYLVDMNEKRNVTLLYSNREFADIAYKNIFDEAHDKLGIKTFYTLTDTEKVPANWSGGIGYITADVIKMEVPDYADSLFYLSGPRSLVLAFEKTLSDMGVSRGQIKTDYFPGFA